MKKIIFIVIGLVALIIILKSVGSFVKSSKDAAHQAEIVSKMKEEKYEEARSLINKYYKDTTQTQIKDLLTSINKKETKQEIDAYKSKIKIPAGWEWIRDEKDNNYTTIHGKIENTGDRTINYFEIIAEYYDAKDKVVSTDSAICSESVPAGKTKNFDIRHKYSPDYKSVRFVVSEFTLGK